MNHKMGMNLFRRILDIFLLCGTLTLYNKRLISMHYHEVAGLIVIAAVLLHIGINLKMVRAMQKNFLKIPLNLKLCLIVDIFLLLAFAFLGVSGVMISKTVLTGISSQSMLFKMGHFFAAACSVILLGIHIGLHIGRKDLPVPVAVLLSIAVFAFGAYGFTNTNELRWLSSPFTVSASGSAESHDMHSGEGAGAETAHVDASNASAPIVSSTDQTAGNADAAAAEAQSSGHGNGQGNGSGQGKGNGQGKGLGKGMAALSTKERVLNVIEFFSMIFSFTMLTYWCMYGSRARKKASVKAD